MQCLGGGEVADVDVTRTKYIKQKHTQKKTRLHTTRQTPAPCQGRRPTEVVPCRSSRARPRMPVQRSRRRASGARTTTEVRGRRLAGHDGCFVSATAWMPQDGRWVPPQCFVLSRGPDDIFGADPFVWYNVGMETSHRGRRVRVEESGTARVRDTRGQLGR